MARRERGFSGFSSRDSGHAVVAHLDHAVLPGVGDPVAEDQRAVDVLEAAQADAHAAAVEDVVAEDQGAGVPAHVVGADLERLRQAPRLGLHGVGELDAERRPVTQQPLEGRAVLGGGDDQDLADPRQHQRGQRVVDHRLVVDRHQLLAQRNGDRIEPGAGAARKDDASHGDTVPQGSAGPTVRRGRRQPPRHPSGEPTTTRGRGTTRWSRPGPRRSPATPVATRARSSAWWGRSRSAGRGRPGR